LTEGVAMDKQADGVLKLKSVADVQVKPVEWLVPMYIPANTITLLCGDGGVGKTALWCDTAAAISRGELPRYTTQGDRIRDSDERKTVMYFSAEDDTASVIKPRLERAGANQKNILYMGADHPQFQSIKFVTDELKELIESAKPRLCIFDPLQSFLDDRVKMGERNAIRSRLDPLAGLAKRAGTTMIIVLHTNKRAGAYGRNRMADSSDLWDRARSVLIAGRTGTKGVFYLSHEKCNYGPEQPTILYRIENGAVQFFGTSNKKDFDFVNEHSRKAKEAPAREDAKEAIMEVLQNGKMTVADLDAAVVDGYGVSKKTLRRAKQDLKAEGKIAITKTGNQKGEGQAWHAELLST